MTRLWKVESGHLAEVAAASPKWERMIEDWIAGDPSMSSLEAGVQIGELAWPDRWLSPRSERPGCFGGACRKSLGNELGTLPRPH